MPKVQPPELKKFMDKKLSSKRGVASTAQSRLIRTAISVCILGSNNGFKLNSNRHVTGVLRGFDQFMNIVLDQTVDEKMRTEIGMVVSDKDVGKKNLTFQLARN